MSHFLLHFQEGSLLLAPPGKAHMPMCMYVLSRSVLSDSLQPHVTVACQAPLSIGFPRQEYWSGLPYPSPGDLPKPQIEPRSPTLQVDSLPSEPAGKPKDTGEGSLSLLQGIPYAHISL